MLSCCLVNSATVFGLITVGILFLTYLSFSCVLHWWQWNRITNCLLLLFVKTKINAYRKFVKRWSIVLKIDTDISNFNSHCYWHYSIKPFWLIDLHIKNRVVLLLFFLVLQNISLLSLFRFLFPSSYIWLPIFSPRLFPFLWLYPLCLGFGVFFSRLFPITEPTESLVQTNHKTDKKKKRKYWLFCFTSGGERHWQWRTFL